MKTQVIDEKPDPNLLDGLEVDAQAAPSLNPFDWKLPEVDWEEVARRARERHIAAMAPFADPATGAFIGTSLGAWLVEAQHAGIPYIGAELLLGISRDLFMREEETAKTHQALWADFYGKQKSVPEGFMVRWDACAGLDLKFAMANREGYGEHARIVHPSDPRACDINYEYPSDTLKMWKRPWVPALMMNGYPVELRVFIENGQVLGVANYYPQHTLPDTEQIQGFVTAAKAAAETLVASLQARGRHPWMVNYAARYAEGSINATLDFLITEDEEVVFLEAGPPFSMGAHPCSFQDQEIKGIALGLAPGVQPRG